MIKNIWFVSFCLMLLSYSCINDDSTLPVHPISEITIETESDTLNVDYGYELVVDPKITQSDENMELKYEWMYHGYKKGGIGGWSPDSLRFLSNEKVLKHTFKKLGRYGLRLKVTNEHGSSFKKFHLNVIAPYEQGIFVLSADENKKGRVSFMRPLNREEQAAGKEETFYTRAFAAVNPEFPLNDPVDAAKVGPDVFILSGADKLVYRVDCRTFQMFNVTDFKKDMDWMQPRYLCSKDRSIVSYLVQSDEGSFASVDYNSDIAFEGNFFYEEKPIIDKKYSRVLGTPIPPATSVSSMKVYDFFLNYENSAVYFIYDLQEWYTRKFEFPEEELINVGMDKNAVTCVVTRSKTNPKQIIMHRGQYWKGNPLYNEKYYLYTYEAENITMDRNSIVQNNDIYNYTYYTNKNKMYRWVIWNSKPELPTEPLITLPEDCEITCFEFTADYKKILLGVYNPNASGMKGSVYVYDADIIDQNTKQLKFYKKYEGVADKPIKIFWKNNRL